MPSTGVARSGLWAPVADSPDALPLSYRRLIGAKSTNLQVYVTNILQ